MKGASSIRFDRKVELAWLDAVAAHVAAGDDLATTRDKLFQLLEGRLAGGRDRGRACHKTVRMLSSIWAEVPMDLEPFRNRAVGVLSSLEPSERIGLHWALLLAGFPFFGTLAEHTGRLIQLQGSVSLGQLNRRMQEGFGDRSTLRRATQRILRSVVEWGALNDSDVRGTYQAPPRRILIGSELALLIVEGLLRFLKRSLPREEILSHPAIYPFKLRLTQQDLRKSALFSVSRQGMDVDYIGLT